MPFIVLILILALIGYLLDGSRGALIGVVLGLVLALAGSNTIATR